MNRTLMALCICGMIAQVGLAEGMAGAPVGFASPGPGLDAPLDNDGEPVVYGQKWGEGGAWTYDGDSASGSVAGSQPHLRYKTTLEDDQATPTAMPEDQDWVFEIVLKQTGGFGSDAIFFAKNATETDGQNHRLVMLTSSEGQDNWTWHVGDQPATGWNAVATGLTLGEDWNTFTTHYKSATRSLDTYQNGELIAEDYAPNHDTFDLRRIQLQALPGGGTSWIRSLAIGQLAVGCPGGCGLGDADGDGDVDDDDLSLLLANWGIDTDCAHGEFSGVPPVNDDDLSLLLANWTGPLGGAVPEPTTMAMLIFGALALLRRRS